MEKTNRTIYIVFISLLLDLLAFTMILPLLPSLLEYYKTNDNTGLYNRLSNLIVNFQEFVGAPERFNSILFGGFLGSMFCFLQFIASPIVGSISDVVGRKPVLLCCLIGISFSYVLWSFSYSLTTFIIARFIGGISKGNVSLTMAVIADVSSNKTRGKGMALIGMAFSLGFIFGPLIGAGFAVWSKKRVDWFIVPALFALFLSLVDLIFFIIYFRETLPKEKRAKNLKSSLENAKALINIKNLFNFTAVNGMGKMQMNDLKKLGIVYFVYLFIYSGLEFNLTFLTHHIFHFNSMQQGWMFFCIGVVMALIQGIYVRKIPSNKIKTNAIIGLWLIIPSFIFIGLANGLYFLYIGVLLFAISTALVVPCMMTLVSIHGKDDQKGTIMGIFRSLGALARALGPIITSIAFWSLGSTTTYLIGAVGLLWPVLTLMKD